VPVTYERKRAKQSNSGKQINLKFENKSEIQKILHKKE
jgi:hypothetical protein